MSFPWPFHGNEGVEIPRFFLEFPQTKNYGLTMENSWFRSWECCEKTIYFS